MFREKTRQRPVCWHRKGFWKLSALRRKSVRFQRLTIQSGERHFYLFCTRDSLEHRHEEIILWADQLARQLCWQIYETTVSTASIVEATERKLALFEHQFPVKP